jgi:hypothetical protein
LSSQRCSTSLASKNCSRWRRLNRQRWRDHFKGKNTGTETIWAVWRAAEAGFAVEKELQPGKQVRTRS